MDARRRPPPLDPRGETSGIDKLSAQLEKLREQMGQRPPWEDGSCFEDRRPYNLRQRKDDSVTMQRRSEFTRLKEQQNQRRNKRKEAETLRLQRIHEYCQGAARRLTEMFNRLPKRPAIDMANTTQIINGDTKKVMEAHKWRPYYEPPVLGLFETTLKGADWRVEWLALQSAPSVVGLKSLTVGKEEYFCCSGTIVESSNQTHIIVTVANLVKKWQDTYELDETLEIVVYLQNQEPCEGKLLYHDFYYNICVVEINSPVHVPVKCFSYEAIDFDNSCSRDVITLGRGKQTNALVVSTGKVIPKCSTLYCEELLVSTCRITKAEVGGPLMNFNGEFIGMNYYHCEETPFIPSFIVLKCLQQFKLSRKVLRPWIGLRVRTCYSEGCSPSEKSQTGGATAVIVEKIEEHCSAKESGLNEGDIIDQVNGVYFSNAAELGGILLDIGTAYLLDNPNFNQPEDSNKMAICIKFGVRCCEHERTIVVDKPISSGLNRWPFPKPIIVKKYRHGKVVKEKWYALES